MKVRKIWDGYIFGPEEAAKQFLFDETYSLDEIDKIAPKILKKFKDECSPIKYYPFTQVPEIETRFSMSEQWTGIKNIDEYKKMDWSKRYSKSMYGH